MAGEPSYTYAASVVSVTDGDTVVLRVDLGFRLWAELPIRLVGLDCAERNTDAGKAAMTFTRDWLNRYEGDLVLSTYKNPEKYGRWLGVITTPLSGSLNAALVDSGHAAVWSGEGPRPSHE